MRLCVRSETPDDYGVISEIHDEAFERPDEGRLVERLRKMYKFIPELSLVAELDGIPVGHILFFPVEINSGATKYPTLALAPLSVIPLYQKKKIGSTLVIGGLRRAQKFGHKSVIVLGYPEYYQRFAFKKASDWGIRPSFEVPDNAFMALEIVLGELEGKTGIVEYPEAFNDV
ncbi:MAG: N-acetyltransferase [Deltaproteobacteria bacterium]|nr:N-acetyltransferase [Deltaproteobacteria bacterium]MBN2846448.1 N-acetyltransferase [Deltaproteobacteria bacterium]